MNRQEFINRISQAIDVSRIKLGTDPTAKVNEWLASTDQNTIMYCANYDYWIRIHNLNTHNPPTSVDDIEFLNSVYEDIVDLPNTIANRVIGELPTVGGVNLLPIAIVGGTVAVLGIAGYGLYRYKKRY